MFFFFFLLHCAFNSAPDTTCSLSLLNIIFQHLELFTFLLFFTFLILHASTRHKPRRQHTEDYRTDNSIIKHEQESSGDVLITGSGCSRALRVAIFPASLPRFTPAFSFYSVHPSVCPRCSCCLSFLSLFWLEFIYWKLSDVLLNYDDDDDDDPHDYVRDRMTTP